MYVADHYGASSLASAAPMELVSTCLKGVAYRETASITADVIGRKPFKPLILPTRGLTTK